MANATCVTPEGRTSFMKVFRAEPNMNKTKNIFSMKLLIPKKVGLDWLKKVWDEVCLEEFGQAAVPGLRPMLSAGDPFDDKGAVMDGDWKYGNVVADKRDMYAAYRDCYVLNLNSQESRPPMVVDEHKQEIINAADFQSGDYARCIIELSSYTNKQYRRPALSIRLLVVQKTRGGERFSGGVSSEEAMGLLDALPTSDTIGEDAGETEGLI